MITVSNEGRTACIDVITHITNIMSSKLLADTKRHVMNRVMLSGTLIYEYQWMMTNAITRHM